VAIQNQKHFPAIRQGAKQKIEKNRQGALGIYSYPLLSYDIIGPPNVWFV